jgi:hypothetical protein
LTTSTATPGSRSLFRAEDFIEALRGQQAVAPHFNLRLGGGVDLRDTIIGERAKPSREQALQEQGFAFLNTFLNAFLNAFLILFSGNRSDPLRGIRANLRDNALKDW